MRQPYSVERDRKYRERYRLKNPERFLKLRRARDKRHYQKHKERILADRRLLWIEQRDKMLERNRLAYQNNTDKRKESAKRWRDKNPEKAAALCAAYARRYPEVYRKAANRRRAIKAGAEGSFTQEQWLQICDEYNQRCACCWKKKILHADHIIPLSRGGSDKIENIQPLCKSCNSKKGTKIIAYLMTPISEDMILSLV